MARDAGDRDAEATALDRIGLVYRDVGETKRALEYHEQALLISQEIGDRRGEAISLGNIGAAYYSLGENKGTPTRLVGA